MHLKDFSDVFNRRLERYLERKVVAYSKVSPDEFVHRLLSYTSKMIVAGGKRLRPYMIYLGYRAAGGKKILDCLPVALGYEIFHFFALVHDDVIDRGKRRHGLRTVHEYFDDAQAILAGDLLLAWSLELINLPHTKAHVASMIDEMVTGQILDVHLAGLKASSVTEDHLLEVIRLKTCAYSFIRPLQIGALLVGEMSPEYEIFAEKFGRNLGIAFQLQDDWLDRKEDQAQKKPTFYTCGMDKKAFALRGEHFKLANDALLRSSISQDTKRLFSELIDILEGRRK